MRVYTIAASTLLLSVSSLCPLSAQTDTIPERGTDSPTALMERARTRFNAKDYDAAIADYKAVVASDLPDDVRARAQSRIGYSHLRKGDFASAKSAWKETAARFPNEVRFSADALLRVGNLSVNDKDFPAAASAYRKVAEEYASRATTREDRFLIAEATYRLGNTHYINKDFPAALIAFREVAERYAVDASSPEERAMIAEAAVRVGSIHLVFAEEAKKNAPKEMTGNQAWELAAVHFEQCRTAFQRVVADFSDTGKWHNEAEWQLVALTYEWAFNQRGTSFNEVVKTADDFLVRHPDDLTRCPKVHLVKAEALVQLRKFDQAIPELLTIRQRYAATAGPALGGARYFLARCYEEKGELAKALLEYQTLSQGSEKSFHAESDRPAALFGIASILKRQSKRQEAVAAFQRLAAEYPNSQWARFAGENLTALQNGGVQ